MGAFDDCMVEAEAMRDAWINAGRPMAGWSGPAAALAALAAGLRGDVPGFREWLALGAELSPLSELNGARPLAIARLTMHEGNYDEARTALDAAIGLDAHYNAYNFGLREEVAVLLGEPADDGVAGRAAWAAEENAWARACVTRAHGRRDDDLDALRDACDQFDRIDAGFEWAVTALLVPDLATEGRALLAELGVKEPQR